MKKKNIIIFGTGSYAKLMRYYFDTDSEYEVKGFTVDEEYLNSDTFENLPVVSFQKCEKHYKNESYMIFSAVGYKNMRAREKIFNKIKSMGYEMPNYVSSTALIDGSCEYGKNNVFMPGSIIEPFVKIKDNNVFWSSVNICHDTKIDSHNFFATGTIIGGCCELGKLSFFGFGSTVIDNVKIADESLIGARSLILKNTERNSMYVGVPGIKKREHTDNGIII